MTPALSLLLWTLAAQPSPAALPKKDPHPAWQRPVAERLAIRFDAEKSRLRDARVKAEDGFPAQTSQGAPDCGVQGRFDSELLLSWEIFDHFIRMRFKPNPGPSQESWLVAMEDELPEYGFDDDFGDSFWKRLALVTRVFVEDLFPKDDEPPSQISAREPSERYLRICRERVEALNAARAEFGADRFDRFLYEVVAPRMNVAHPCSAEWQIRALFLEGGCR
jgi:hypothetical protein